MWVRGIALTNDELPAFLSIVSCTLFRNPVCIPPWQEFYSPALFDIDRAMPLSSTDNAFDSAGMTST